MSMIKWVEKDKGSYCKYFWKDFTIQHGCDGFHLFYQGLWSKDLGSMWNAKKTAYTIFLLSFLRIDIGLPQSK